MYFLSVGLDRNCLHVLKAERRKRMRKGAAFHSVYTSDLITSSPAPSLSLAATALSGCDINHEPTCSDSALVSLAADSVVLLTIFLQ